MTFQHGSSLGNSTKQVLKTIGNTCKFSVNLYLQEIDTNLTIDKNTNLEPYHRSQ